MAQSERERAPRLQALVRIEDRELRRICLEVLQGVDLEVRALERGLEPLVAIRELRPDLFVADAGVGDADGAGLAEQVRADFAIRHVAVVAIDAPGPDESPELTERRILEQITAAVGPRRAFELGLDTGEGVSGRIEEVGARTVLEAVSRRGRDRRVTIWLERVSFLVEFRGGELYSVEFTDADGDPASGPDALERLLQLDEGVFEVAPQTVDPDRQFDRGTTAAIEGACARLSQRAGEPSAARSDRPLVTSGAGRRSRVSLVRAALVVVVLAVLGGGIFLVVRLVVLGGGAADEQVARADQTAESAGDAGTGAAGVVSELELQQLEAALRRAVSAGIERVHELELEPDGGVDAPAPSSAAPGPSTKKKKKPGKKGAKQQAAKPPKTKPPAKKKGDQEVEAMIDDLGIKFD